MSNPWVREVGTVEAVHGFTVHVGVDYDSVTLDGQQLPLSAAEEFGQLFIRACWEAGANAERMRADAPAEVAR